MIKNLIRGATAPKSHDRLKRLLLYERSGGLVVSKMLSLNLYFSFLNLISQLLNQVATQSLTSRGWVDPVPDPKLPETCKGIAGNRTLDLLDNSQTY